VTFNDDASLDTSQAGGGGRGVGGLALGGGGLGIVGVVIFLLVQLLGGGGGTSTGGVNPLQPGQAGSVGTEDLSQECRTGADANAKDECRIVGFTNSVQNYWTKAYKNYRPARTIIFQQAVQTGCGNATSEVGPFYCPADGLVYLDIGFFNELTSRFGARGGPFAQGYVIAHEYGHHIQNLLGTSDRVQQGETGPQSGSVRLELQADCYAGAWAKNATSTTDANGKPLFKAITRDDIETALDAAQAVGDDRIQEQAQGRVSPESWTHGSAAQRYKWFQTGYNAGNPNACDTFSGSV
jgi:hypothetical protein